MKPLIKTGTDKRLKKKQSKRILLYVEDEEENRSVAKLRLRKNYNLLLAATSKEACKILSQRSDEIEAILMDIELQGSDLDGIKLTKLIRGTLNETDLPIYTRNLPVLKKTPILFVTAYGDRYSEDVLIQAGGNQLIRKPVDFVQLAMTLTRIRLDQDKTLAEKRGIPSYGPVSEEQSPGTDVLKPLLLYVEENEENRNIATSLLKEEYEMLLALNAEQACETLASHGGRLSAILMTVKLQGSAMDGIILTKLFRGTLDWSSLPLYAQRLPIFEKPIFFVTAGDERSREKEIREAGANRLIRKPVDLVQLKMALTLTRLEQNRS